MRNGLGLGATTSMVLLYAGCFSPSPGSSAETDTDGTTGASDPSATMPSASSVSSSNSNSVTQTGDASTSGDPSTSDPSTTDDARTTSTTTGAPGCAEGWWDSDWPRRIPLTIDNSQILQDLPDFPVLVSLTADDVDYGSAAGGGEDLRFVLDGSDEPLPHEIEAWNADGTSLVWVGLPTLPADGADPGTLYAYYGNEAAAAAEMPSEVWSDGFDAVLHLDDLTDASGNGQDATGAGPTSAAGRIGVGRTFDGIDDALFVGAESTFDYGSAMTFEAWFRVPTWPVGSIYDAIATKGDGSWRVQRFSNNATIAFTNGVSPVHNVTSVTEPDDFMWHYVVATYSAGTKTLYLDGVEEASAAFAGPLEMNDTDLWLGGNADYADRFLSGQLDEVRLASVGRNANWVAAQYQSMTGALIAAEPEEICE